MSDDTFDTPYRVTSSDDESLTLATFDPAALPATADVPLDALSADDEGWIVVTERHDGGRSYYPFTWRVDALSPTPDIISFPTKRIRPDADELVVAFYSGDADVPGVTEP